jgi:hypothetical protein
MELFVGALTRTAETDPHSTLASSDEPPTNIDSRFLGVWSRPHQQPSTFLDTAIEPVPWPKRGDRPAPTSRPLLPHERAAPRQPPSAQSWAEKMR